MAAAEGVFRARLAAASAVTTLVGPRIYGSRAPKDAPRPFLVLRRISGGDQFALDGAIELRRGRMQIDAYADTYEASVTLGRAARAAIIAGNNGDCHAEAESEIDLFDDQAVPNMFRRSMDFMTVERD